MGTNRIKILNFFLFLSSFILFACKKPLHNEYSIYYNFNEDGLLQEKEYLFIPFENLDTVYPSLKYNLKLSVRFTDRFNLSALPLNMESGYITSDTIESKLLNLSIFSDYENEKKSGNYGIYEIKYPIFNNVSLKEESFISILTHEKSTPGIIGLGIIYETL